MGTVKPHLQSKWPCGFQFCKVGAWMLRKLPTNPVWVACAIIWPSSASWFNTPATGLPSQSLKLTQVTMQLVFQVEMPPQFLFFNCPSVPSYVSSRFHNCCLWKGYFTKLWHSSQKPELPPFIFPTASLHSICIVEDLTLGHMALGGKASICSLSQGGNSKASLMLTTRIQSDKYSWVTLLTFSKECRLSKKNQHNPI